MQRVGNVYKGTHTFGYDTNIVSLMKNRFEDLYSSENRKVKPDCEFAEALEVLQKKIVTFDSSSLDGDGFK